MTLKEAMAQLASLGDEKRRVHNTKAGAHPHTRWTMNAALAQIGIHHHRLRRRAVAIGE